MVQNEGGVLIVRHGRRAKLFDGHRIPAGAEFGLVVGEPAQFRFLSSTTRRDDRVGSILEDWADSVAELAPIEANLPATKKAAAGTLVPVRLRCKVTAVGTLELWCHERDGAGKWKLELNVRE